MSFKKQWAMLAVLGRPCVKRSFGVLLVLTVALLAGGGAGAQTVLDFDTSGPTTTAELENFVDLFGFEPDFGGNWTVDPNALVPANGNALHTLSNGTNVDNFFTSVAIFKGSVFSGENVVYSADISSPDNDIAGLYVRYTGNSDVGLENTYYFVRLTTNGSRDSVNLHKVKDGVEVTLAQGVDAPPFAEGETHKLQLAAQTVGNTVELTVSIDNQAITGMDPFVDATNPILGPGRVGVGQSTNPVYFDNISFLGRDTIVQGDFNGDGDINMADFLILATNFNTVDKGVADGDLDFNGRVNGKDFLAFREIFNSQGQAGVAGVPEPSSCLLSLLGIVGFAMGLRRRTT